MKSWTNCFSASGPPNACRSWARRHISSKARSAEPIARMQWWMRPGPSRSWAIANPAPLAEQVGRGDATALIADLAVARPGGVAHHRDRADQLEARRVGRDADHRGAVVGGCIGVGDDHRDRQVGADGTRG